VGQHRDLLIASDLFDELGEEVIDAAEEAAVSRELARGDVLFRENDPATELFVVAHGRIAIANRSADGRESLVALMERGSLFGEMPFFDRIGRSADARALEPSTVVILPYSFLTDVYTEDPARLWGVVRLLAGRLRNMDAALADSVFLDVTGRTAKRLLELAGDGDDFMMPITQEELAGMVGASRERVNKAISSFIRLGWISQSDRHYRILKRDQLEIRST
jgi:CRP-like cAMP-binding protein